MQLFMMRAKEQKSCARTPDHYVLRAHIKIKTRKELFSEYAQKTQKFSRNAKSTFENRWETLWKGVNAQ